MSLLIFIIIIAVVVYSYTKQQSNSTSKDDSRTNQRMWTEAARNLNLQIYPPGAESVFPSLSGTVNGLSVEVWGDFNEDGHGLVVCRVDFANRIPFRFHIVKGDFGGDPAGASFEIRGLSAPGVRITASNGKDLQAFLTPQNINILKNCLGCYHIAKITDSFLVFGALGINDGMSMNGFIERAVTTAKALSGNGSAMGSSLDVITPVEDDFVHPVPAPHSLPGSSVKPPTPVPLPATPPKPAPVIVPPPKPEPIVTPPPKVVPVPEAKIVPSPAVPPKMESKVPPPKPIVPAAKPIINSVPETSTASEEIALTENGLAEALFSVSFPGEKEKAMFAGVIGKSVQWRGTLKSVYPYSSDFVFGKGPGTKATFEICEVASAYGMKNKIKATVSLGEDALQILKGNTGKEFAFTGTLLKFEPFAREILLEKGSLQG